MTGSALSFDAGRIGVAQVLAVRRLADGDSGLPATRDVLARGRVNLLAVTVIGHDRPGIIADVTGWAGRARGQPRGLHR